jgi:hypothetical protein
MNTSNDNAPTPATQALPPPPPASPKKPTSRRGLHGVISHLLSAVHIVRNEMPNNAALNAFADLLNHFVANLKRELEPKPENGASR